ncbi:unnamed protein product [Lactuca virosa]|uniref:Uncharacterized protein n=1 Tax=Lactuca virosa TaxID=75947 RepID=A0AAU9PVU4_9ASTR|nr:unnamed protein product [Lactuca virosa]
MTSSSLSNNIRRFCCGDMTRKYIMESKEYRSEFEEKDCGYFCWINPPVLTKWYKEKLLELGVIANDGVVVPIKDPNAHVPLNVHVNQVKIHVNDPNAPINALEPVNQVGIPMNAHVPTNVIGF